MVRPVTEGITVTIKGRLFELVWDDDLGISSTCEQCVLLKDGCKDYRDFNLMALCLYLVEEPNTYFIETPVKA